MISENDQSPSNTEHKIPANNIKKTNLLCDTLPESMKSAKKKIDANTKTAHSVLYEALKNYSENEFFELFNAYLIKIKNENMIISYPVVNRIIKQITENFDKTNKERLNHTATPNQDAQYGVTIKNKIENTIFNLLDWQNLPLILKRHCMVAHIIAGNVEHLENIILKNDTEIQFFIKKELPYLAAKHNQMKVLELALMQFNSNKKDLERITSAVLERSIEYGYEEMSIDLIVNKGAKIYARTLRYAKKSSANLKNILNQNQKENFIASKRAWKLAPTLHHAEQSDTNLQHIPNQKKTELESNIPHDSIEPDSTNDEPVIQIITKGSIDKIKNIIEKNEPSMIEYLKKNMVNLALWVSRADLLQLAFDEFYKNDSDIKRVVHRVLKRAVNNDKCENIIKHLLDRQYIRIVSRRIFYCALKNHSESIAEQLFPFINCKKSCKLSWEEIYLFAQEKKYFKITKLIDDNIFCTRLEDTINFDITSEFLNNDLDLDGLFDGWNESSNDTISSMLDDLEKTNSASDNNITSPNTLSEISIMETAHAGQRRKEYEILTELFESNDPVNIDEWLLFTNDFLNQFNSTSPSNIVIQEVDNDCHLKNKFS